VTAERDRIERELSRLRAEWHRRPGARAAIEAVARRLTAQLAAHDRIAGTAAHRTTTTTTTKETPT